MRRKPRPLVTAFRIAILCPACGHVDPPVRSSTRRKDDGVLVEYRRCTCGESFRVIVEIPEQQETLEPDCNLQIGLN